MSMTGSGLTLSVAVMSKPLQIAHIESLRVDTADGCPEIHDDSV